jgi:hypothetical protein
MSSLSNESTSTANYTAIASCVIIGSVTEVFYVYFTSISPLFYLYFTSISVSIFYIYCSVLSKFRVRVLNIVLLVSLVKSGARKAVLFFQT